MTTMAAILHYRRNRRQQIERVYRDRTNPVDVFNDEELYKKFRFRRQHLFELTDAVEPHLLPGGESGGVLPALLQLCVTLRYLASGTFQDAVGEMIGISQATVSRTVRRVMNAFWVLLPEFIQAPSQQEADAQKRRFSGISGFPGVFACIDGTLVRIQRPRQYEADYVNRKNYHSLNVQIVCDANLRIVDCVARHPGSAHDARVLRESHLFAAMEQHPRQIEGIILGDSGYPVREWLMTPFANPVDVQQENFNIAHRETRVTVERCIGVLKRRFHCLHTELRLEPAVCSQVVYTCCMLHNKATQLGLDILSDDEEDPDEEEERGQILPAVQAEGVEGPNERARSAAGKVTRLNIARTHF